MAEIPINRWEYQNKTMARDKIVRLQILMYCHLFDKELTDTMLDCMTLIGTTGHVYQTDLMKRMVQNGICSSGDYARNMLSDLTIAGLIVKDGQYRKKVSLHPIMRVQTKGNILLEIKCLCRDAVIKEE